ncbi:RNA polymerase sigma factor [Actinomycetospora sp. TBRC 11914]|uniref:RNA polymerase sigma factor n=1 Tax=Actinomycetospora sp. TBRC 11914 TaxID=2729387 RepID=UPI00145D0E80|nr:sigma-70 family RNA polymerase sigma factor [Actinomycetospora sp. TBRC 11914]NMO88544.1 sigma-70 family RNA polymerase sigma factor [Actinomycetospora sp. TBRC 11914]
MSTPTVDEALPASRADPDAERVAAALAADLDDGFAELVRTYQGLVFAVALRTTGHRADAEDLAAEALLRAYRSLADHRATDQGASWLRGLAVRPWLLTIVVNTRRNQVRDAARRPRTDGATLPEEPVPGPSVEERAEHAETTGQLASLLARLPETQRTAVVLRHVTDLPLAEVAEVLGCPVGTAKSHVSRGLARLRTLITDPSGETP